MSNISNTMEATNAAAFGGTGLPFYVARVGENNQSPLGYIVVANSSRWMLHDGPDRYKGNKSTRQEVGEGRGTRIRKREVKIMLFGQRLH